MSRELLYTGSKTKHNDAIVFGKILHDCCETVLDTIFINKKFKPL